MTHRRAIAAALLLVVLVLVACASSGPTGPPSGAASPDPSADASTAATLSDTRWSVVSIAGSSTLPGSPPTMAFGADGLLQGTGGCNGDSGPYRLDGNAIEVGELASTLILCEGEVGAQEAAFMAALRGADAWRIDQTGDLVLSGVSEIVAQPAVAEPSRSPDGSGLMGAWALAELGPTADFAHLRPAIEFRPDGTLSGFAGCNSFSGSYEADGASLMLGPLATTKMACQRPASAVEAEYLGALGGVTGWAIDPDGRLRLDGPVTLRFSPD